eukprot:scaffold129394_cov36-Prasinocladus_malaysianus.AAC.1
MTLRLLMLYERQNKTAGRIVLPQGRKILEGPADFLSVDAYAISAADYDELRYTNAQDEISDARSTKPQSSLETIECEVERNKPEGSC